jgi:HAD superfamily hydrolase (TIGR01450 family)
VTTGGDLAAARGWVFDVDGCLVQTARAGGAEGSAFPGGVELVAALKAAGRQVLLCTNASARTPARYAAHLRHLGFGVADDEFVTAGSAAADHVAAHHPGAGVLVLGGEGVVEPMAARGIEVLDATVGTRADVVVIGSADTYTTAQINAACLAVDAGAALYTTVWTPWFHGGLARSVAVSSAMAAAVSWVTGVAPQVVGKPSAALAERLLARFGPGKPGELVVVGDHTAEIELARAMGARSVLVLSGATAPAELAGLSPEHRPDVAVADVDAVHHLVHSHLIAAVGARS